MPIGSSFRSRAALAAVVALAAPAAALVGAAPAHAAGTVYTWVGGVSNVFDDRANWSPNTDVPGTGDTAVIGKAGTYTLTFNGNRSIDTIELGDDDAHVTLDVTGGAVFNVITALHVAAGSTLHLDHADGTAGSVAVGARGTVTNDGSIVSDSNAPNGDNSFAPTLVNHGTLAAASGRLDLLGDVTNSGTVSAAAGASLNDIADSTHTFTTTGTLANAGSFTIQGTRLALNGGTTTGLPIAVSSALLTDSGGTGTFSLFNSTHFAGTIGSGQTFVVGGGPGPDHTLIFDAPSTVAAGGRIDAAVPDTNGFELAGAPLTNNGTIDVSSTANPGGLRTSTALTNNGIIAVHSGTLHTQQGGVVTNHGLIAVDPGARVELLDNVAGPALVNAKDGTLRLGLAGPRSYGAVTGTSPLTPGGTLDAAVARGYRPAGGATFPVVAVPHTGRATFARVARDFTASYGGSTISLVRNGGPAPSPTLTALAVGAGRVAVTVVAPRTFADTAHRVTTTLTLQAPGVLATTTVTLTPGAKRGVTLVLGPKARAFLAAHPKARVTLVATTRQAGRRDATRSLALGRPRKL